MLEFRQNKPGKKLLCICGSPRKGGNSDIVIDHFIKGYSESGLTHETIYLRDLDFKSCLGCESCRKNKRCIINDDMQKTYEKIVKSKAILLVSPAHNYNVTALMKAFIDRLYCFYNFDDGYPRPWSSQLAEQDRKSVIVSLAEQFHKEDMGFTNDGMRKPAEALGYETFDTIEIYKVFEKGKVLNLPEELEKVERAGRKLADAIS